MPRIVKFINTESRMMVARGSGKRNEELVYRLTVWNGKKVLEMGNGDDLQNNVNAFHATERYT